MIGCMILGTFAAVAAAKVIRHHYGCASRYGGHFRGGFAGHCGGGGRMGCCHRYGWGGGFGPDQEAGYGPRYGDHPPHHADPFGHQEGSASEAGGGSGRGRRGHMADFILNSILGRVRATATQERVIRAAVDEFREEMKDVGGGEGKKTRQDIGSAMRNQHFDEVFMGELFARQDTAIEKTRKAFVGLMAKVHEVLDEEQRGRLADLVEKGPRFWRRGFDW